LIHWTEKALTEHGSKIGEAERRAVENALADLKEALKGDDAGAITTKTNALAQASMKLGEAMYKQAQEDEKPEATVEARNRAEVLVHSLDKVLAEHTSKVGKEGPSQNKAVFVPDQLKSNAYRVLRVSANSTIRDSQGLGQHETRGKTWPSEYH